MESILEPSLPPEAVALFNSVGYTFVGLVLSLSVFLCVRKFLFFLTWRSFRDGPYVIGQHQWRPGNLAGPQWCNVCEAIVYGIRSYVVKCDICGMYAHAQCAATTMRFKSVNGSPSTSESSLSSSCSCRAPGVLPPSTLIASDDKVVTQQQRHMWIKGNIDPMDSCSLCGLFCGSILALSGLKCSWCHVRVHEECFQQALARTHKPPLLRRCDLGRHASLILPPSCVILHEPVSIASKSQRALNSVRSAVSKMSNIRLRRPSGATDAHAPPTSNFRSSGWENALVAASSVVSGSDGLPYDLVETSKETTPLLVFINSRSGGKMGLHVLRQVRMWLNPLQVHDLSHQSPIEPLRRFIGLPRLRILVCGGDGTVGWVLGALDEIGAQRQPPIAVLPLGTGNDLARVLGWGAGFSAPTDVSEILSEVEAAHVSLLDRWQVNIGDSQKRVVLNNYVGVGVDAQVALEFHEQRERSPGLFMSQFVNKLWYSQFGAKNFLVRTCAGLPEKIILVCDGKRIPLPVGTEGVILLNINSYGGGSKLWHDDAESDNEDSDSASETDDDDRSRSSSIDSLDTGTRFGPSSPHDGLLDVVAVYGTLHLGQMQVGLSKAVRLCQAKSVRITLKETLPVQIDGEPWLQNPGEMELSFFQQAFMLSRTVEERDVVTKKVGEVLDWAEHSHVITSRQRDVLLVEIARRVADSAASRRPAGSRAILSTDRANGSHSFVSDR
ncbi:Diacylglycerol kinase accessory domain [Phytophthora infestans]|uniref:Diacylglycerol kinase n=1 Tax=Phytophthora infestans TaxID=4787 RepID=A0A8S9VCZ4_PHYIN|nr:Diacylglycerol kinase accessory domain [Phytophthora infestans]